MDDDPALARRLVERLKLNDSVATGDEKLGQLYGGAMGLPLTYLIDRHGTIEVQFQGEVNVDSIEAQFKPPLQP